MASEFTFMQIKSLTLGISKMVSWMGLEDHSSKVVISIEDIFIKEECKD
jgi:hypothetical protein